MRGQEVIGALTGPDLPEDEAPASWAGGSGGRKSGAMQGQALATWVGGAEDSGPMQRWPWISGTCRRGNASPGPDIWDVYKDAPFFFLLTACNGEVYDFMWVLATLDDIEG
jgi:hypothetical protein